MSDAELGFNGGADMRDHIETVYPRDEMETFIRFFSHWTSRLVILGISG